VVEENPPAPACLSQKDIVLRVPFGEACGQAARSHSHATPRRAAVALQVPTYWREFLSGSCLRCSQVGWQLEAIRPAKAGARPSMAISPKAISNMPPTWTAETRSPKTALPRSTALTGIKRVTREMFVAPAVARIRKKTT